MSVCLCRLGHGLMAMEVQAGPGAVLTLPPDGHGSPGRLWSSPHSPTSTWPWVQVSMYMVLRSSVQDFHSRLVTPASPPTSQAGSSSLCKHPVYQSNHPLHRANCCFCKLSSPLGLLPGDTDPNLMAYFLFLPDSVSVFA